MRATTTEPSYRTILTTGRVVRPFAASVLARLPVSMAPLGIVILVQHVVGSYGVAGLATGAFAIGTAVGGPIWGRGMDRYGQSRVMAVTALVSAALLATLALLAIGGASTALLVGLAAATGLASPAVSPAMRVAWRVLLPDERQRSAAYALDAVAVESIFVVGPLLLSLFIAVAPPVVPLLVTAVFLAVGGAAYSRTEAARRSGARHQAASQESTTRRVSSRVLSRTMVAVLAVAAAMAVGFGCIDTSLAATAREIFGSQARVGLLFMAIAGGSATGGLWYGRRHFSPARDRRRLGLFLATFATGLAPIPFLLLLDSPRLWMLMPLLYVAGVSIAPAIIIMQNLVDRSAPKHRVSEAQAWLSTAVTTGAAAGTAAAGGIIDAAGVRWSFAAAVLAVVFASVVAFVGHSAAAASRAAAFERTARAA